MWNENDKERQKKYRLKNKEHISEVNRLRYQKNIKKNRNYARKWAYDTRIELKIKVYNLLGNKCINPYNIEHGPIFLTDIRCLQIDHINGNGKKEYKKWHSTSTYLRHILKNIDDYQLLCANCNWIKRKINKEEPIREL